jgi:hypothetical protein
LSPERDQAISKEHATAGDINTKHNEHERLAADLENKRIALDNIKQQVSSITSSRVGKPLMYTYSQIPHDIQNPPLCPNNLN